MSNLVDLELVTTAGAEAEVAALGLGGPHTALPRAAVAAPPAR